MSKCPWTGRDFKAVKRGGHEKVFADDMARAEAHKAARLYTERMIEEGFLTWGQLHHWFSRRNEPAASYTTEKAAAPTPPTEVSPHDGQES